MDDIGRINSSRTLRKFGPVCGRSDSGWNLVLSKMDSTHKCKICKKDARQCCPRCQDAWYCSKEYHAEDWEEHKQHCETYTEVAIPQTLDSSQVSNPGETTDPHRMDLPPPHFPANSVVMKAPNNSMIPRVVKLGETDIPSLPTRKRNPSRAALEPAFDSLLASLRNAGVQIQK